MGKLLDEIKKVWGSKGTLDALDAYALTKYGIKLNEDEIFTKHVESMNRDIRYACDSGKNFIIHHFDSNIEKLQENLVTYFKHLGYQICVLDSTMHAYFKTPLIYITWAK